MGLIPGLSDAKVYTLVSQRKREETGVRVSYNLSPACFLLMVFVPSINFQPSL